MSERKFRIPKTVVSQDELFYLDGLLDAYSDFSDASWSCACQDAIAADPRFEGRDPYTVWINWVEARSEKP